MTVDLLITEILHQSRVEPVVNNHQIRHRSVHLCLLHITEPDVSLSQSPPFLPQAVSLPLSLGDGKWHHVCVTWTTRDGQWEVFQDGVQRGSGANLSAWHPIKPGGIFILGQEQVKPPPR